MEKSDITQVKLDKKAISTIHLFDESADREAPINEKK